MRDSRIFLTILWSFLWFILIILSYRYIDFKLATYISIHLMNASVRNWVGVFSNIGLGPSWLIGLLVLSWGARYVLKKEQLALQAFYLWLCVSVSGIAVLILKTLLGRPRPEMYFHSHITHFSFVLHPYTAAGLFDYSSFPSGHATTIAAVGMGIILLAPSSCIVMMLLILCVALSRVLQLYHFLSDAMAGVYLGSITAIILYHLFYKRFLFRSQHD